ncbi:sulfatase-like hydrolase/transferase [Carboxylicivirga mesophila]|uniref:Sulfatase-like hydrolase/transferase n=1 Tax=Carboxylicivirga mesophila TaxID=1166478 RepID=A0ABS5K5R3_9BACT|nr:sulfatase-like hydrolase/transferase [Carboxylicivirga mesophila]MBS2210296.1 sulfatase-like hydrolase/transferase [Carboxylicivirga mesophila]
MNKIKILLLAVAAILSLESCSANKAPKKPNVIVILADDLGYAGLSCFGGEGIATPHLDKLAENGVKCSNFYANSTVCSPTRVALFSGRYQQRVGLDHIYFHCVDSVGFDPKTNPSLPLIMKEAGYKTGVFGKWHLGSGEAFQPKAHGFDEFTGFLDGNIDFVSKHNTESEVDWFVHHQPTNQEGYVTNLLNQAVVDFIDKEHEHPFFIYLPEAAVHVPMQGPNDAPLRTDDFYAYAVQHKFPKDEYMRRYSEMVRSMDDGVGMIMQALRKYNIEDNTLIIFTSDNGGEGTGVKHGKVNGDHRGHKVQLYEGGIKVPALFYWKGQLIPSINDNKMLTMDLLPTILEMCAIDYNDPHKLDGISLKECISDNTSLPERDLFWMHTDRIAMQRGHLKLLWLTSGIELYDLKADPLEQINLANSESYQSELQQMQEACLAWQKQTATGFPGQRKFGDGVKTPWPCSRDLNTFNAGKKYYWENDGPIIR